METPEKSGNPSSYPAGAGFAALLDWHLDHGTRPQGSSARPGRRWGNGEFAGKVGGVTDRSVRNWRKGRARPYDIGSIERELFGDTLAFDAWRRELRAAYDDLGKPPPPPAHFLGRDDIIADLLPLLDTASGAAVLQGGPGHHMAPDLRALPHIPDAHAHRRRDLPRSGG